jgi:hypothetical protein
MDYVPSPVSKYMVFGETVNYRFVFLLQLIVEFPTVATS